MDGALYNDVVEKTYTIEEGSSEADKTALKALYEAVKDMVQGSYSEESWQAFQSALSEAQAVLENASAGQAEVDAAFTALLQARDGLEREVNKELFEGDHQNRGRNRHDRLHAVFRSGA